MKDYLKNKYRYLKKLSIIKWIGIRYKYLKGIIIAYLKREKIELKKKKQAYVMLAANYNNLGDIAITKSQEEFLKKNLPKDYEVIVIPFNETYKKALSIKQNKNDKTIITLIGGGNSGTLYEFIEEYRRFILKFFKNFKIISFPQSVFFDSEDKTYKKEFVKLCKNCKNLTLIARERRSYEIYKSLNLSKTRILLVPDIVFTLDIPKIKENRKGISYIFRNDKEKEINQKVENEIIEVSKKYYSEYSFNDTCDINIKGNGYKELEKFITSLMRKELVVTDRLHGMILSYITDTPCISLDNNNHKIESTYKTWLSSQNLVYMSDDSCEVINFIKKIKKGEKKDLSNKYNILIESLVEENGR